MKRNDEPSEENLEVFLRGRRNDMGALPTQYGKLEEEKMKEITDKMNAIELQTRELLEKAKFLEDQKNMMANLMDCSVHDHQWILRNVVSDLTNVYQLDIRCERCGAYAMLEGNNPGHDLVIWTPQGAPLSDLVGEEE